LFVYSREGLTALRSADGSILWTTSETWYSGGLLPTEYGLLSQAPTSGVALRDPQTGELRRVWPQILGMPDRAALHGKWAAIANLDVLWLIDLSGEDNNPSATTTAESPHAR
jgi:hypothetical protein